MQIEIMEAMLNQGARHLDRQAVASLIIRGQLDPKDGRPVLSSRLAEAGASTQPPCVPFEDPRLKVLARHFPLPGDEEVEEVLCSLVIGLANVVEVAVARVHLVRDERRTIQLQKIAQDEPRGVDEHGCG
jgi:hypothetical protein